MVQEPPGCAGGGARGGALAAWGAWGDGAEEVGIQGGAMLIHECSLYSEGFVHQ